MNDEGDIWTSLQADNKEGESEELEIFSSVQTLDEREALSDSPS